MESTFFLNCDCDCDYFTHHFSFYRKNGHGHNYDHVTARASLKSNYFTSNTFLRELIELGGSSL